MLLLAQFHTSKLFETSAYDGAEEEEEEGGLGDDGSVCGWPPFRKVGGVSGLCGLCSFVWLGWFCVVCVICMVIGLY